MSDRPILFSAPMVRALLEGRKTQTRRVMNPQPQWRPELGTAVGMNGAWVIGSPAALGLRERGDHWRCVFDEDHRRRYCTQEAYGWGAHAGSPYGVPGDRLWVREAFRFPSSLDRLSPVDVGEKALNAGYAGPWAPTQYEADSARTGAWSTFHTPPADTVPGKLRPGIHMPRWASRITLEVTGVRVERLQDISEADAQAEGARECDFATGREVLLAPPSQRGSFVLHYRDIWEQINGAGSWDANPWVWCIEFRRTT